MRLRHPDGTPVHLAYCSNVHQAEDLDGVLAQLAAYAEPVRERLGVDRLGIGLWLARDVVTELVGDERALGRLKNELSARGLETVTLNAFPYSGFHREVVKKDVYLPDWTDEARLTYTLDCARVLTALLPDDALRGSVSTLPLAWRTPWPAERSHTARRALDRLADGLAAIERETGRPVRVGFEPEPGCVVETTAQAARELGGLDPERLGICLDACHLAVQFEDPRAALARLSAAGLPVVKLQASCAVQADDPADPAAQAALGRLAEPRFLHQTRTRLAAQGSWEASGVPGEGLAVVGPRIPRQRGVAAGEEADGTGHVYGTWHPNGPGDSGGARQSDRQADGSPAGPRSVGGPGDPTGHADSGPARGPGGHGAPGGYGAPGRHGAPGGHSALPEGTILGVDDLPDALAGGLPTDRGPWRVHFHAPLHAEPEPPLRTTAPQLTAVLAELLGGPVAGCDHIEVETYTWSVLPRPPADLAGGIAAELAWARDRLTGLGLKEETS
ncbi:metabolite traffic protein EboE [Streptomyces ureilyticus]|uniref:metabolite traffic protein EboE n=1 Tax=Streptomyces ureilyticus TaxID=1775131 RepID=UPI001F3BC4E8|nr:metabolite traffic protein EboE [Streptomyces ureilyticus]